MTFHVHPAERTDLLADGLAALLSEPLDDPFATELVVVAALGTERWLSQRLSHHLGASPGGGDGVTAGVRFARPQALAAELLGIDDDDPWRPDALLWPIAAVIEECLDEPWLATVARHLGGADGDPVRRHRRLTLARHLAASLHGYARQRPEMTARWSAGADEDGAGSPLPEDLRWQAELWRRLRARVDAPSPDERIATTIDALTDGSDGPDLPRRVSLFGHHRLPLGELRLLAAVAVRHDVHLWIPHPSPRAWRRLADVTGVVPRAEDTTAERIANRTLATLGRDVRELQRSLQTVAPDATVHPAPAPPRPDTVLGRLQADIAADRPPSPPAADTGDDRSLQVHACHGRARQVEVLRDVLVGLLQDDPTLEPRDIVVMVPDIESYAPLFRATFGLAETVGGADLHPGHRLEIMLADRAPSRTNPLLALVVAVLDLALRGRATNAEVLDLLSAGPVRQRFDFDDDALERIAAWVEQSAVRWGLDLDHRRRFGLDVDQNTWRAGLDRLVAGVVAAEDPTRLVADVLALDDVPSGDVDLVGRLVTAVEALARCVTSFSTPGTMADWTARIRACLDGLTDTAPADVWQRRQADHELEGLDDTAIELSPGEVLGLLRDRWAGRPSRASFRTGRLTVCTMVPMRSVPHRVVCLVGLDDGVFPRSPHVDGDDVLARRPLTGERDPRTEDRQLLLDAVMSATETLVVTYAGADEHRGQSQPPAVPLGELIDAARVTAGRDVVVSHPLQPFDPRNLTPGAIVEDRPFSFDPVALAAARSANQAPPEPGPFLREPLPAPPRGDLELTDLEWFVQNPVAAFWRQRLDVTLAREQEPPSQDLPIHLDGLERWRIGQRLLDDAVRGVQWADAWKAVRRAGMLPPGELGRAIAREIDERVATLVRGTAPLRAEPATTIDVDVTLPDGRRLTGAVEGVHGERVVTVTYSSIRPKHHLRDWVRLLALTATRPDVAWVSHTAGKVGRGSAQLVTGPIREPEQALGMLTSLIELRDEGLRRPLPLPVETARVYARHARRLGPDAAARLAAREWTSPPSDVGPAPERQAPEIVRVWGADAPFDALLADGLAGLASRLWNDALDHQTEAPL